MEEDNKRVPVFEIGDIVIDTVERKKWLVTFIYTPWMDNIIFNGAYCSMKLQFPNETFFYALRLKRGKRECIAPESQLEKI